MKKLLFSFLTIGLVSIGAFTATRAYFSDQATVLGNSITTGKVDIDLRGPVAQKIDIPNLMPGVWTDPIKLEIFNKSDSYPVKYKFNSQDPTETITGLYWKINVRVRHTFAGTANPEAWPVVYDGMLKDLQVFSSSSISEVLNPNNTHVYYFEFQLDPTAGNTYQNGSATFDLYVNAIQKEANW